MKTSVTSSLFIYLLIHSLDKNYKNVRKRYSAKLFLLELTCYPKINIRYHEREGEANCLTNRLNNS